MGIRESRNLMIRGRAAWSLANFGLRRVIFGSSIDLIFQRVVVMLTMIDRREVMNTRLLQVAARQVSYQTWRRLLLVLVCVVS